MSSIENFTSGDVAWDLDFSDGVRIQVDGNDLVAIKVANDGTALVTVFTSTDPDGDILWQGNVDVAGHLTEEAQ